MEDSQGATGLGMPRYRQGHPKNEGRFDDLLAGPSFFHQKHIATAHTIARNPLSNKYITKILRGTQFAAMHADNKKPEIPTCPAPPSSATSRALP
ncbi:MAG: hypothetical protein LDL19_01175 [Thiobacillus sp.]|nr:hypothetical protein [Thiobacillus sp.]